MKSPRILGYLAITLVILLWGYFVFWVPTFDFDESLYRRVAETMREKKDPWLLTWDDRPLHHKPPLFYWLIWAASIVIDSAKVQISAAAARLPSLIASACILFGLHRGMRFIVGKNTLSDEGSSHATSAFLSASFPILTATAVIFDPLQTLALLPAILIPTRMFFQQTSPSRLEWLIFGMSLSIGTAIKGLNGAVIPCLALLIHLLLHLRSWGWPRILQISWQVMVFGIFPGAALCFTWFYLLHHKIGPAFTEEFFWVQHLGRSQNSMEDHSGGWYYHPLVLFFGSGFLTPLLFRQWVDRRPEWLRVSFPLTFVLSCVLLFTASATKLPHYLWPAWPALALFSGLLQISSFGQRTSPLLRMMGLFSALPVILLGVALFVLAVMPETLLGSLPKSPQSIAILSHWMPLSFGQKISLLFGSLVCATFLIQRTACTRSPQITAVFSVLSLITLVTGILPTLENIAIRPFQAIASDLKKIPAYRTDCIRYSGSFSATLSLALAPELIHNRCEPGEMRYLISPEWKADECDRLGFKVLSTRRHLVLCGKP